MDEHMFQIGERVRSVTALGKVGSVIEIDHDREKARIMWGTGRRTWVSFEKLILVK
jgi:hypothetical protein